MVTHMLLDNTDDALLGGVDDLERERDDIWKFDAKTKRWKPFGKMVEARGWHAVSTVANKDLDKYCNN